MSGTETAFPPVASADARVLILGSMPGRRSLDAGQYYAHPRNAFWPIMAALFGIDLQASYAHRCQHLRGLRVALWDVLHACERPGSLDADIRADSMVVNDFDGFLDQHRQIRSIFFNGAKSEQLFRRHVTSRQETGGAEVTPMLIRLPSTSPAHAGMPFDEKLRQWNTVKEHLD